MNFLSIWGWISVHYVEFITNSIVIFLLIMIYIGVIVRGITLDFIKDNILGNLKSNKFKKTLIVLIYLNIAVIIMLKFPLKIDLINVILTTFSIFCGLLFNLLVLVYDLYQKTQLRVEQKISEDNLTEALVGLSNALMIIYKNITMLVFISMLIVIFSFVTILGLLSGQSFNVFACFIITLMLGFIKGLFETLKSFFTLLISSIE